jgi:signal transduction histidine kinase
MKRAGRGDLSVRSTERRGDEVGELSDAFNRMMDELESAREREKVQRAQLAHKEKMVAVGTLAAGVAHEVNNPLSGVQACLDNLRAHPDDVDMRERYFELIRDGLKRIERTVANLLNFSRQREIRPEPTSINHNLRHVAELVGYQLRRANVEVRYDLDRDKALVMADHFQMEQLFLNLVLNALEAMPEGGTLTLRTRVHDGQVIAEVSDTGSGIPEDIRDRIFDPFFTTREVGEGTGLGLAVSDSIVAAHGGVLEMDSKVGEGTTFRVRMASTVERSYGAEAS